MTAAAWGAGWLVNLALPDFTPPTWQAIGHDTPVWQWIALAGLTLLFGSSLLRQGARGFFFDNLLPDRGHHHHHHDHGHDHGDGHHDCGVEISSSARP